MRLQTAAAVFALMASPIASKADDWQASTGFECADVSQVVEAAIDADELRLSNVVVREGRDPLTAVSTVTLDAAVVNKLDDRLAVSVEAVAMQGGAPLFAISTSEPFFGSIGPRESKVMSSTILHAPGSVDAADELCIRVRWYPSGGDR